MEFAFPIIIFFNIILGTGFLLFWGFVFITLYHLVRFGVGVQPKRFAVIFFFGSVLLFSASTVLYINLDLTSLAQLL